MDLGKAKFCKLFTGLSRVSEEEGLVNQTGKILDPLHLCLKWPEHLTSLPIHPHSGI